MTQPFRYGILGTANIADSLVHACAASEQIQVAAIAGRDEDRTRAWAAERGVPLALGSYDALIASGAVDAVYVALPNTLHADVDDPRAGGRPAGPVREAVYPERRRGPRGRGRLRAHRPAGRRGVHVPPPPAL